MEANNIEYVKLNTILNDYAIDKLYDILERYGANIDKETFEEIERKILSNKVISVDRPNIEDNQLFNNNIPVAHGPRTKNDGLIHIYPYVRCNQAKTTDELANYIIESGIITHEIFHYFIKLDDPNLTDLEEVEFSHYLTEGMVQLYTEEHEKKKFADNEYRKNVILARQLKNLMPQECTTKTIFRNNYTSIKRMYPETKEIYERFLVEKKFLNQFNELLKKVEEKLGINYKELFNRYKKYTIEETVEVFKEHVDIYVADTEDRKYFNNAIDSIYQALFCQKEKRL